MLIVYFIRMETFLKNCGKYPYLRITCLSSEKPFFRQKYLFCRWIGVLEMLITLPNRQTNSRFWALCSFNRVQSRLWNLVVLCVKWTIEFLYSIRYFTLLSTGWIMLNIMGFIQQYINFSSMYAKHFLCENANKYPKF